MAFQFLSVRNRKRGKVETLLRRIIPITRGPLRSNLVLAGFIFGNVTWLSIAVGEAVILPACFIHLWAKGCLSLETQLTTSGPYQWTRNPFYLANFFIDLGICLAIHNKWVMIVYFAWFAIIYYKTIRSEEAWLESQFGEPFREFCRRVPRFFPWKPWRSKIEGGPQFSWRNPNLSEGIEYARVMRVLCVPLLIWMVREAWLRHWSKFTDPRDPVFAGLVAMVVLYVTSWAHARYRKAHRPVKPAVV